MRLMLDPYIAPISSTEATLLMIPLYLHCCVWRQSRHQMYKSFGQCLSHVCIIYCLFHDECFLFDINMWFKDLHTLAYSNMFIHIPLLQSLHSFPRFAHINIFFTSHYKLLLSHKVDSRFCPLKVFMAAS